jgi:hypothetical protein
MRHEGIMTRPQAGRFAFSSAGATSRCRAGSC